MKQVILKENEAQAILQLLQRVTLQGAEVPAYVALVNKLSELEESKSSKASVENSTLVNSPVVATGSK